MTMRCPLALLSFLVIVTQTLSQSPCETERKLNGEMKSLTLQADRSNLVLTCYSWDEPAPTWKFISPLPELLSPFRVDPLTLICWCLHRKAWMWVSTYNLNFLTKEAKNFWKKNQLSLIVVCQNTSDKKYALLGNYDDLTRQPTVSDDETQKVERCDPNLSEQDPTLVKIDERTLACFGNTEVDWIWTNVSKVNDTPLAPDHFSLVPAKKNEVILCNDTNRWYFKSTLDAEGSFGEQGMDFVSIGCRTMNSDPTNGLKMFASFGISQDNRLQVHHRPWLSVKDFASSSFILTLDEETGSCSCRASSSNFTVSTTPKIYSCNGSSLVDCENSVQDNFRGRRFLGTFTNYCPESSFQNKDSLFTIYRTRPGLVLCFDTEFNFNYAYVPFIIVSGRTKKIGKDFGREIFRLQQIPGYHTIQTNFDFGWTSQVYWSPFSLSNGMNRTLVDSSEKPIVSWNSTARFREEQNLSSIMVIGGGKFRQNVTLICEATVIRKDSQRIDIARRNFTVQVPNPSIHQRIACSNDKRQNVIFVCRNDFEAEIKWFDENGKDLCRERSFQCEGIQSRLVVLGDPKCPKFTVTCTATISSGKNESKNFEQGFCEQQLAQWSSICADVENLEASARVETGTSQIFIWASSGGAAIAILILLPCIGLLYRKVKQQRIKLEITEMEINEFLNGNETMKDQGALFLPYNTQLEISRDKIKMDGKILGSGNFGKVFKGIVDGRPVAVKAISSTGDGDAYLKSLLSELKIMSFVGRHDNIVELVGACTANIKKKEVYVVFEFCVNGNLLEYIRLRRDIFKNQLQNDQFIRGQRNSKDYLNYSKELFSEDLIRWSFEIASGMDFIAAAKICHGDLALRNILLSENLEAKIGDFGLSKQLYQYSVYVQKLECPLPLRWLAIESLRDLEFSIQSDVWSYGVTLWEIFSLGSTPYPGIDWNFQTWKLLNDGHRMERPDYASQSIHGMMLKCWEVNPMTRPTFTDLKNFFDLEFRSINLS